jgi:trans-2-enoyl-CoA reductase
MSGYNKFDAEIYSEELQPVSESEYDEAMRLMAEDDFAGYPEWSDELESENFVVRNGKLEHKPEPLSRGRRGGIEI